MRGDRVAAAVLLALASLGWGAALAQTQMQEHVVGGRWHYRGWGHSPHRWDYAPSRKPTAAACRARAKQQRLRGSKASAFVRACLKS